MKTKGILLPLIALVAVFAFIGCNNAAGPADLGDTTAPTVVSTIPADLAENVSTTSVLSATFSEDMDPATIVAENFTVFDDATTPVAVAGTVSYDQATLTASFIPAGNLDNDTQYTATLTASVADLEGNTLEVDYVWTFTTASFVDIMAPTVDSTIPADAATGVNVNSVVSAIFSEGMDAATIVAANFTVFDDATTPASVAGTVSYNQSTKTASFAPSAMLDYDTQYTATLTTSVADLAGNTLAEAYVWTFTTTFLADTIPPTVVSTIPANLATDVSIDSDISAIFSEDMNPTTIAATSFTLFDDAATPVAITGTVGYDLVTKTASFAPTAALEYDTLYTATLTSSVADIEGNTMEVDYVWTFTTAATPLEPVLLGTAANFVILAKTAISTIPASVITGDVGISPAAESFMTGFSQTDATGYATSTQVTGFLYAADMAPPTNTNLTTAIADMQTAYSDAAGRSNPDFSNLNSGAIGGLTLEPGLYTWGSSVSILSDVTISGGADDVWIFQMTGNLTMDSGFSVLLSGGAQAKNIFWQVAGLTTIGATAHFEGVILCQTDITLGTGASMNGKALSQTQVALDQATVTDVQ